MDGEDGGYKLNDGGLGVQDNLGRRGRDQVGPGGIPDLPDSRLHAPEQITDIRK